MSTAEVLPDVKSSRFDHRREKILNAASSLFNRHGLRDATLTIIAAEIGLNFKSLRYYFKLREDLVSAVFMRSIDLHLKLAEAAAEERGLECRLRRFVRDYFELLLAVRLGTRPEFVYFGDLRALTTPHSDDVWPAYGRMFKAIRKLFQVPGVTWDGSKLNAATHMFLSQLLWTPVWTANYFPQDVEQITRNFADILLYGIAAKGVIFPPLDEVRRPAVEEGDRLSQGSFLRKAISLINQHGYRGASVDRISTELNVTKGAFYHHNETLDELVVGAFECSFANIRAAQDDALARETTGSGRITAAAVSLVRQQMLDEGTLLRTAALTALNPELRTRMAAEMGRLTLRFSNMLNDGLIDGSVRPCNLNVAAEMTTAMINSSEELRRWVHGATEENAAELYVAPLMTGLLAYAGVE